MTAFPATRSFRRPSHGLLVVAIVAAALAFGACSQTSSEQQTSSEPPTAVVLIIGDGLGASQISLARDLRQGRSEPGTGSIERFRFESLPVIGTVSTHSSSNWVTDSAAAATAFATGVKTDNQRIGQRPDGSDLASLADRAREQGWRIGYVTNTEVTHATPAGFYANVPNRYLHTDTIAEQLLAQAPDLVLGGGQSAFLPSSSFGRRQDDRNLISEAEAAGYTVWDASSDRTAPVETDKLLGLFAGGHLPFDLDRRRMPELQRPPELAELTRIALDRLSAGGESFFLLLEGGRIDHAGHDFDAAGIGAEVEAFDLAVAEVLEFQQGHPGTLIVLTADHATGGLAINDHVAWNTFADQRASLSWIVADIQDEEDPADVEYLRDMTGMAQLTEDDLAAIVGEANKYAARRILGRRLGEHNGVTWTPWVDPDPASTKGHTGEDVPLYAGGPGAERFSGAFDNSEIPSRLCEVLGWPALNP